jgi:hypothetical protein
VSVSLLELAVADPCERWASLGFAVVDGGVSLGGVRVRLGVPGAGIVAWTLGGEVAPGGIDGLVTCVDRGGVDPRADVHPNRAVGVDHVVVVSPDFDRTAAALAEAGLELRRIRDAGGLRQGFRRLGPAILEVVEARDAPAGPAAFWGLVVTVVRIRVHATASVSGPGQSRSSLSCARRPWRCPRRAARCDAAARARRG